MRIGIMGGTFDPIHYGHLRVAEVTKEQASLDSVLFVPNGHPPHKHGVAATVAQRWDMCELALMPCADFHLSNAEMSDQDYFYTYETLQRIQFDHPGHTLCLIIGSDQAKEFNAWRNYEQITKIAELVIVEREHYPVGSQLMGQIAPSAKCQFVSEIEFQVPSTEIRNMMGKGRSARFLVPDAVLEYIEGHGIYRPGHK